MNKLIDGPGQNDGHSLKITSAPSDKGKQSIWKFVLLPAILVPLLLATGTLGILVSKKMTEVINGLDEDYVGPVLRFQEISFNTKDLANNLLYFNSDGLSQEVKGKTLKKMVNLLEATNDMVKLQQQQSVGKAYKEYLDHWSEQWFKFSGTLAESFKMGKEDRGAALGHFKELDKLSVMLDNVSSYTKIMIQEGLIESKSFAHKSTVFLIIFLLAGAVVGYASSTIIVKSLRRLFLQISDAKRDIEKILNNLSEGLMVFNQEGLVGPGHSLITSKFFGGDPTNRHLFDVLQLTGKEREEYKDWLPLMFSQKLDFNELAALGPAIYLKNSDYYIGLNYRPVYLEREGKMILEQVICIAVDKTKENKFKLRSEREKKFVKLIISVLNSKESFIDFIKEGRRLIRDLRSVTLLVFNEIDWDMVMFKMHTLKGMATSYYLIDVENMAHRTEDLIVDWNTHEKDETSKELLKNYTEMINKIHDTFEENLNSIKFLIEDIDEKGERERSFSSNQLNEMRQFILKLAGEQSELYKKFRDDFILERVDHEFKKFRHMVMFLAKEQLKKVDFDVATNNIYLYLHPYASFLSSLVHVFRNIVDHGIETEDERLLKGKPKIGHINISFERLEKERSDADGSGQDSILLIKISDDGRGMQVERIREVAIKKMLITAESAKTLSRNETLQLIFLKGFSMKDKLSNISGRGVGMSAVKMEVDRLGGKLWVESTEGQGTSLLIEVPVWEHFLEKAAASSPLLIRSSL